MNRFTSQIGSRYPIICGAMYPCSNPELVAAVSKAGGVGIVQPVSLTYVHGYDFREGLQKIIRDAGAPIGMNLLIEKSSAAYLEKNKKWLDIALEEGVRFFITALGNPDWVVERCKSKGAIVYHDVTAKSWAQKAIQAGVNGLICVNNRAGGHAGHLPPEQLLAELKDTGLPLICAGGIGGRDDYQRALQMGYEGVQMGTRFIASQECKTHPDYKNAILKATAADVILTKKITGVPVSVIKTPYIEKMGIEPGWFLSFLLRNNRTKHYVRMAYSLLSFWRLKHSLQRGSAYKEFFQAGKSVESIDRVETVQSIIDGLTK